MTQQRDDHQIAVPAAQGHLRGGPTERLLLGAVLTLGPLVVFEAATGPSVAGRDRVPWPFPLYLAVAAVGCLVVVLQIRGGTLQLTSRRLSAWVGWALVALPVAAFGARALQGVFLDHVPAKLGLPLLYALPIAVGLRLLLTRHREGVR